MLSCLPEHSEGSKGLSPEEQDRQEKPSHCGASIESCCSPLQNICVYCIAASFLSSCFSTFAEILRKLRTVVKEYECCYRGIYLLLQEILALSFFPVDK